MMSSLDKVLLQLHIYHFLINLNLRYLLQLNYQIFFHVLRHTHAAILISSGENINVVSERLAHTDIRMTLNTYTHVMENMKNKTANLLDDIFE